MSSDAPLEPNRHEVANVSYPANDFQRDKLLVARRGTVGALPPSQSDIQGASRTRATSSSHVTTQTTWNSPSKTPLRTRRTHQQMSTKTDAVVLLMHPIGGMSLVHARRKSTRVSHPCFEQASDSWHTTPGGRDNPTPFTLHAEPAVGSRSTPFLSKHASSKPATRAWTAGSI